MLTKNDLDKISMLAKLKIPDAKKDSFLDGMNRIFDWIDQLSKIDVPEVDETAVDISMSTPESLDVPAVSNTRDELMLNAKYAKFGLFCVPKVVE
ncbi:MAG: Asp-tRNA(Asn)/Glu-tRNA(Gln) amidotransferase subunit GatC [Holosporales bacterium]|jgi:aspartyl/glutamyl-tRNA(Asn/Gln) amidotransferase C subunit|nr:Asp-tRNA(Asn)/Glu-tRNA(Gln) amidotransferase subunit GatC [Holosporales bacterium]